MQSEDVFQSIASLVSSVFGSLFGRRDDRERDRGAWGPPVGSGACERRVRARTARREHAYDDVELSDESDEILDLTA